MTKERINFSVVDASPSEELRGRNGFPGDVTSLGVDLFPLTVFHNVDSVVKTSRVKSARA